MTEGKLNLDYIDNEHQDEPELTSDEIDILLSEVLDVMDDMTDMSIAKMSGAGRHAARLAMKDAQAARKRRQYKPNPLHPSDDVL